MKAIAWPAVVAAFLWTTSAIAAGPEGEIVIYKGAALIDGSGAPLQDNMAIVVKGERIDAVMPAAELSEDVLATGEVVDAAGWYAVPGLIDTHVHLATSPSRKSAEALMRRMIYSGVTTVRDMAGDVRALSGLSRAALLKEIPAPDLYYAALMAGPSFFHDKRTIASAQGRTPGEVPWMQAITEDTDIPLAVALARGTGATAIKIYANLPGSLVHKITAEAHRQDFLVWTHGMIFPATPAEIVAADVDVMSHACLLAYHVAEKKPDHYHNRSQPDYSRISPDGPEMRALFRKMAQKDIILDATLRIYDVHEKQQKKDPNPPFPFYCPVDFAAALTLAAHEEGVEISTGTDGRTPIEDGYPALHEELELLVHRVGLSPLAVIRSASLVGAMTLGRAGDMGTIEPGKLANIVFVSRNPLRDIGNLRSVLLTVKRGTRYARKDYRPIAAGEVEQTY